AEANAAGPCKVVLENMSRSIPKAMDERFQAALEQAAERHAPGLHQRMPSGAGHDAQILAAVMPAAMLFVPSIGGRSHDVSEDTAETDIRRGAEVYAAATMDILATGIP
ncbi:MAG: M20/M25/M40 family metallo-hydrolase, partial [Acetobacteraceae bacterium]|nr:M20/M25/M40 family metallo-hydrolase [Acetobacteraceae bacterium]